MRQAETDISVLGVFMDTLHPMVQVCLLVAQFYHDPKFDSELFLRSHDNGGSMASDPMTPLIMALTADVPLSLLFPDQQKHELL